MRKLKEIVKLKSSKLRYLCTPNEPEEDNVQHLSSSDPLTPVYDVSHLFFSYPILSSQSNFSPTRIDQEIDYSIVPDNLQEFDNMFQIENQQPSDSTDENLFVLSGGTSHLLLQRTYDRNRRNEQQFNLNHSEN
jgi:hypothetical protein